MAVEIERKFLVKNDLWKGFVESEAEIKQGYVAQQDGVAVRVRIASDQAWLTIKGRSSGISRLEYEYSIPRQDAVEMLSNLAVDGIIHKTRFKVRCGAHVWDLDRFYGENEGLLMAEVELSDEVESFVMPEWAGREVSDDIRYYNAYLVSNPYALWTRE